MAMLLDSSFWYADKFNVIEKQKRSRLGCHYSGAVLTRLTLREIN